MAKTSYSKKNLCDAKTIYQSIMNNLMKKNAKCFFFRNRGCTFAIAFGETWFSPSQICCSTKAI